MTKRTDGRHSGRGAAALLSWVALWCASGCSEKSPLARVVPTDGGLAVIDGGVAVIDGGVAVIDGGVVVIDGGVGVIDGGVGVIDGGVTVIDGGVGVIDGGVAVIDGGVGVIDGGVEVIDGGVAVSDGGVATIDGGVAVIDGGVRYVDGGVAVIDGGVAFIDGGVAFVDGGVAFVDGGGAPSCFDGVANGAETGTDCGGPICAPCSCHRRVTAQRTYWVCPGTYTWSQARSACLSFGADLASARTAAEQTDIDQAFTDAYVTGRTPDNVGWIGGTDVLVEGTWRWSTGAPVTFTAWAPGEPNNGAGTGPENCLVTCPPTAAPVFCAAAGWNDARCDATYREFACAN